MKSIISNSNHTHNSIATTARGFSILRPFTTILTLTTTTTSSTCRIITTSTPPISTRCSNIPTYITIIANSYSFISIFSSTKFKLHLHTMSPVDQSKVNVFSITFFYWFQFLFLFLFYLSSFLKFLFKWLMNALIKVYQISKESERKN